MAKGNKTVREGGTKTPVPVLLSMLIDEGYSPSYRAMLALCRQEITDPSENTMQMLQWCRLQFDIVKAAKEEQRLLNQIGSGVSYTVKIVQPTPPELPEGVELPEKADKGEDTVH